MWTRITFCLLTGLAVACSNAASPGGPAGPAAEEKAEPAPDTLIAKVEKTLAPAVQVRGEEVFHSLEERMRELKIPALSIAVIENYEVRWAKAYGLADVKAAASATRDTRFLAGSISKSVNALAQLIATEEGLLSLDAPINDYLETWKLPENELTAASPVTLRKLLSHTAGTTVHGFRGYAAGEPVPTIAQILDGKSPANSPAVRVDIRPGETYRYSGGGTTITQLALVERAKKSYPTILAERVLEPLAMTASSFEQDLAGERLANAAAGYDRGGAEVEGKRFAYPEMAAAGLWTTPTDLARFFIEIAKARAKTSQVVSHASAIAMTTPVIEANGAGIGLGVFISERRASQPEPSTFCSSSKPATLIERSPGGASSSAPIRRRPSPANSSSTSLAIV